MFNIEEKIKKWLGLESTSPVVDEGKQETTTKLTSSKSKSKDKTREEMIDTISNYYKDISKLESDTPMIKIPNEDGIIPEHEKEIQEDVNEKYKAQELKLKDDLELKEKKAQDKIDKLDAENIADLDKIDSEYAKKSKSVQTDSIKSGLSRSSIVGEKLKSLGLEKLDEYAKSKGNLLSDKESVQKEIENYQKEYENAINNLNVKKAVEIKNKLEKFIKENGDPSYVPTNDEKEIRKEKDRIYYEIVNEVLNYYYQMSPEKALEEYRNDKELKKLLKDHAKTVENYLISYAIQ